MKNMAAKEARAHFGELMDTVQREPVSIEKHGRPVAVLLSAAAYEKMKREHLQTQVSVGFEQLDQGQYAERSVAEILEHAKIRHEKI